MESQQKLVILGGGESGVGAALLGQAKGFDVFLSDKGVLNEKYKDILHQNHILFEEQTHTEATILNADIIIKSPGIPDKAPIIQQLKTLEKPILSEIEFAARYTDAKLIAITGSNGKTTTTLLTYHLLRSAGLSVGLAGNIGESFAKQVIHKQHDVYVLELSSFQLDNMYDFKADISVILNITPDHLDRYGYVFQNYVDSKFRITQNQSAQETLIYFADSDVLQKELAIRQLPVTTLPVSLISTSTNGGFANEDSLILNIGNDVVTLQRDILPLQGPHNAINMMVASAIALKMGVTESQLLKGLQSFQNAPHRLEKVGEKDGVIFINDSKATNVDSVFYALGSFEHPIILLIGGVDKGNDYDQIRDLVTKKVKGLIALGADNSKLEAYFKDIVPTFYSTDQLEDALVTAQKWATTGDVVLLSPACASFDLFKNYEDRGNQFRACVQRLIE